MRRRRLGKFDIIEILIISFMMFLPVLWPDHLVSVGFQSGDHVRGDVDAPVIIISLLAGDDPMKIIHGYAYDLR